VLVNKFKSLDQPQSLVNRPTNGQIVDSDLPDVVLVVNDEQAPVGDAGIGNHDSVSLADGVVDVGDQRDLHLAQTALLPVLLGPSQMGKLRVGGAAHDVATQVLELFDAVGEGDDLGRADKGEVEGVEEQDGVLAFVIGHFEVVDELAVDEGGGREVGGLAADFSVAGGPLAGFLGKLRGYFCKFDLRL